MLSWRLYGGRGVIHREPGSNASKTLYPGVAHSVKKRGKGQGGGVGMCLLVNKRITYLSWNIEKEEHLFHPSMPPFSPHPPSRGGPRGNPVGWVD